MSNTKQQIEEMLNKVSEYNKLSGKGHGDLKDNCYICGISPSGLIEAIDRLVTEAEVFVPVKSSNDCYEVSNLGNVRSVPGGRRNGILLKQSLRGRGYSGVSMVVNGISKSYNVHRLVAEAFISNPENKPCVNHIDGNKENNVYTNLEWVTYSENEVHSYESLGKEKFNAKLKQSDVEVILKRLEAGEAHAKIALDYPVNSSVISRINTGKAYIRTIERIAELQSQLTNKDTK